MNPTKVLLISSRANVGAGGEAYLLKLLRLMDRARFTPLVVLPAEGSLIDELQAMGVEFYVVGNPYTWLEPMEAWTRLLHGLQPAVYEILDIIRRQDVKLVHTNTNYRFEGAFAAALAGVHHVYLAHIERQEELPIYQRVNLDQASFARLIAHLSSRTVAVSQSVAQSLSLATPPDKLTVVYNGIEIDRFDEIASRAPSWLRQELGIASDDVIVGAVGRIAFDKGFDLLLRAADQVRKEEPNVHFVIAGGDGPAEYVNSLHSEARELGVDKHVHFLGFREDVPEILTACDIFLLSSRREGHAYVLLEAMAARCAPVAALCAGVAETLEDGITGMVVPLGDSQAMGEAVLKLVKTPQQREAMANAAHAAVRERFTAERSAEGLFRTYDEILAEPPPLAGDPGVAMFLQACSEFASLGQEVLSLKSRLKELEQRSLGTRFDALVRRAVRPWNAFRRGNTG